MSVPPNAFVVIAEFQVKPDKIDDFLAAAHHDSTHSVAHEPGCCQFHVIRPEAADDVVLFYEIYENRAAFDAHLETPHLARFRDSIPELIVEERAPRFSVFQLPPKGLL